MPGPVSSIATSIQAVGESGRDAQRAAVVHRFDGVLQQVGEHLLELAVGAVGDRVAGAVVGLDSDPQRLDAVAQQLEALAHQLGDVDRVGLDLPGCARA